MSSKVEFVECDPAWSPNRDSLAFWAIADGSRRISCILPYVVACDGQLDGRNQESNTRTAFARNKHRIQDAAKRLIETKQFENADDLGEFVRILHY